MPPPYRNTSPVASQARNIRTQCEGCGARRAEYRNGMMSCAYCGSCMPGAESDQIDVTHLESTGPEYVQLNRRREDEPLLGQPTPQRRRCQRTEMNIEHLIVKFQARSATYTQQAQPYLLKQEETARAWLGRALEADEIVRDLQSLKETTHGVPRLRTKTGSNSRNSQACEGSVAGAEGGDDVGTADAAGPE